jgi:ribosomal-protein-alanine N-acetyltransferase
MRDLTPRDERAFVEATRRSTALHRPWSYPPRTAEDYAAYVRLDPTRHRLGLFGDDDALVGSFSVSQIFYGPFRSAYLGYFAFVPYAGQGYMREGLRLVLRFAFSDLRLHRLQASIQPANARSIALVAGAGFRKEGFGRRYLKIGGRWRDHEHWVILAEDLRSSAGVRSRRSEAGIPRMGD